VLGGVVLLCVGLLVQTTRLEPHEEGRGIGGALVFRRRGTPSAGDIGKGGFWWGTWHPVFWTCHSDVILGLGREGVTWKSWRIWGRKFFQEQGNSFSEEITCLGILFEYHVES